MSRKVLVAYDGSLLSRQAIQESKNQVSLVPGTEVHIVSVVNPTGPSTNVGLSNNIRNELAEKFEEQLKSIREEFERENIPVLDRKSTRLNSSHVAISYAVFCLKKKKKTRKYQE